MMFETEVSDFGGKMMDFYSLKLGDGGKSYIEMADEKLEQTQNDINAFFDNAVDNIEGPAQEALLKSIEAVYSTFGLDSEGMDMLKMLLNTAGTALTKIKQLSAFYPDDVSFKPINKGVSQYANLLINNVAKGLLIDMTTQYYLLYDAMMTMAAQPIETLSALLHTAAEAAEEQINEQIQKYTGFKLIEIPNMCIKGIQIYNTLKNVTKKDALEKAKDKAGDQVGVAKEMADSAKDTANDAKDKAEDAKGQAEDAKDKAEDTANDAKDKANDAKDSAENAANDAKDKANDAKDSAENAANDAKDKANDAKDYAQSAVGGGGSSDSTTNTPNPALANYKNDKGLKGKALFEDMVHKGVIIADSSWDYHNEPEWKEYSARYDKATKELASPENDKQKADEALKEIQEYIRRYEDKIEAANGTIEYYTTTSPNPDQVKKAQDNIEKYQKTIDAAQPKLTECQKRVDECNKKYDEWMSAGGPEAAQEKLQELSKEGEELVVKLHFKHYNIPYPDGLAYGGSSSYDNMESKKSTSAIPKDVNSSKTSINVSIDTEQWKQLMYSQLYAYIGSIITPLQQAFLMFMAFDQFKNLKERFSRIKNISFDDLFQTIESFDDIISWFEGLLNADPIVVKLTEIKELGLNSLAQAYQAGQQAFDNAKNVSKALEGYSWQTTLAGSMAMINVSASKQTKTDISFAMNEEESSETGYICIDVTINTDPEKSRKQITDSLANIIVDDEKVFTAKDINACMDEFLLAWKHGAKDYQFPIQVHMQDTIRVYQFTVNANNPDAKKNDGKAKPGDNQENDEENSEETSTEESAAESSTSSAAENTSGYKNEKGLTGKALLDDMMNKGAIQPDNSWDYHKEPEYEDFSKRYIQATKELESPQNELSKAQSNLQELQRSIESYEAKLDSAKSNVIYYTTEKPDPEKAQKAQDNVTKYQNNLKTLNDKLPEYQKKYDESNAKYQEWLNAGGTEASKKKLAELDAEEQELVVKLHFKHYNIPYPGGKDYDSSDNANKDNAENADTTTGADDTTGDVEQAQQNEDAANNVDDDIKKSKDDPTKPHPNKDDIKFIFDIVASLIKELKILQPVLRVIATLISNYRTNKAMCARKASEKLVKLALKNLANSCGKKSDDPSLPELINSVNTDEKNFYTVRSATFSEYLSTMGIFPDIGQSQVDVSVEDTNSILKYYKGEIDKNQLKENLPTTFFFDNANIELSKNGNKSYKDGTMNEIENIAFIPGTNSVFAIKSNKNVESSEIIRAYKKSNSKLNG